MLGLDWHRCQEDHWCDFFQTELPVSGWRRLRGVYVIWHGGDPREIIQVGQGDIRTRIIEHRKDPAITAYRSRGPMYVTWDFLDRKLLDGVERYLLETIRPLHGGPARDVDSIEVNLPLVWMRYTRLRKAASS